MSDVTVQEAVINALASEIHQTAIDKGFWGPPNPFIAEINSKLMLIESEAAEAMEELRQDYSGEVNPYSQMTDAQGARFIEEVIDIIIRALDLVRYFEGVHGNAGAVLLAKMDKNAQRPVKHGKRY